MQILVGVCHANLLQNPSLEDGTTKTNVTDWTLHTGDTFREPQPVYGYTDGPYPDGDYALKMWGSEGDIYQTNIAVTGNVRYTIRGEFYHSSTEDVIAVDPLSVRMFMHVQCFDMYGNSLQNDYTINHNGTWTPDVWTQIALTVTSPFGADHATFHVETDSNVGGGAMFGDKFYFDLENLLDNPSMEVGTTKTNVDSWVFYTLDTFREPQPVYGYTDGPYPDGEYAVKMWGAVANCFQTNIAVVGGADYMARGEFYHSTTEDPIAVDYSSCRMFMHLEWFDRTGASLRHDYSPSHSGMSAGDVWTQIVLRVTAPLAAKKATFYVETDQNVPGGSVFGDDFFFAQETALRAGTLICIR